MTPFPELPLWEKVGSDAASLFKKINAVSVTLFLFEFPHKDRPSECPVTEWMPCNPLIAQECQFLLILVPGLFDSSYKQ